MAKTIVLAKAVEPGLDAWLREHLPGRPWAAQASRIAFQRGMAAPPSPGAADAPPAYDAVIEVWSHGSLAVAIADDDVLASRAILDIRASEEVVARPPSHAIGPGATPGLSQLTFLTPLPGLSRAEFVRHWTEHIPLALAIHVGMNRYLQDYLAPGGEGAGPWYGMAHLHFPDAAALRDGLFRSPEDIATITADVAEFIGEFVTMLADEHVVKC